MTVGDGDTLRTRATAFRQLHETGTFVMPCAWDAASAVLFERGGFEAIGTTSGGVNWSAGRLDYVYGAPSAEMLAAYGAIASSVAIPTSGDLENGYSDDPDDVAALVSESIGWGMVGGSIEDQQPNHPSGLVPIELAVEKVAAARAAADASGIDYTLTARAESLFAPVSDTEAGRLDDSVERALRYVEAGADCIFIPGLADLEAIRSVASAIGAPLSIGVGSGAAGLTVADFADAGVRRISTGGALPRAVLALIERATDDMVRGNFAFAEDALAESAVNDLFGAQN